MKKILIIGSSSYIGKSFKQWVSPYPDMYSVDSISIRDDNWKEKSFAGYDVIFHTAAIVHVKEKDTAKYFKVNRDVTIQLASKAQQDGVKQFIFLSTMGVYGTETGYISLDTVPAPKTPYAQSKYEAEQLLLKMDSHDFRIAILRPPIVYGKGCPGNYIRLSSMARKLPFFPEIENQRSMIFIDNLSEFIRLLIDCGVGGVHFPQNSDYVSTSTLVKHIAKSHGKNIKKTKLFSWAVSIGVKRSGTFRKVFGSFVYDKSMSKAPGNFKSGDKSNYEVVSFEESIISTEGREQ